ncbi:MAG: DNA repair protein RecN [Propionibacteriaceae bacterium]|jgi:DNA repair protein RecN (Recombination protein N)|nr:DNA repair protein RecN [Propionibacteriaceae bacterium]
MLAELRIRDLGVIGEASIEPSSGFTVVTGETGAGKTMIVTGLTLLGGAKASPSLIRTGAARALVEGRWAVDAACADALEELGAEVERDAGQAEVLVGRQLAPNRSRLTVGGLQVPLAQGAQLVGEWVVIHGQSEQVRLGEPARQREVLDVGLGEVLAAYEEVYQRRAQTSRELDELTSQARARLREMDLLRFGLDEIAKADPQPGEDVALAEEAIRLQAVDDLRLAGRAALNALAGDDESYGDQADALGLVGAAQKALSQARNDDRRLAEIADGLADAAAGLADTASSLASYLDGLEADPLRLEWIAGRRAELQGLTRKYGQTVDEVLAWAGESARRLAELDGCEDRIEALRQEVAALDEELAGRADELTGLRSAAAEQLSRRASAELAALAMPNAKLEFSLTRLPEPGPHGQDRVQLLFRANPGAEPGPLGRIASGGELSRVRLALEVVLADDASDQTLVFDEVDAGVGGAVALEIGRRLKRLARRAQVVVVTHLAQVAAFADRHYVVSKADDGQVTTSGVREVDQDERVDTLARMMGGLDDSAAALGHARDLLRLAQTED